jgi:hypothetical protein
LNDYLTTSGNLNSENASHILSGNGKAVRQREGRCSFRAIKNYAMLPITTPLTILQTVVPMVAKSYRLVSAAARERICMFDLPK